MLKITAEEFLSYYGKSGNNIKNPYLLMHFLLRLKVFNAVGYIHNLIILDSIRRIFTRVYVCMFYYCIPQHYWGYELRLYEYICEWESFCYVD